MRSSVLLILAITACSETSFTTVEPDPVEPVDTDETVIEPDPGDDTDTDTDEPIASAPLYANTKGELFTVDPQTGWVTAVGTFRHGGDTVEGMVDIAVDADGRLFGATFDTLWRVDPETAALSPLCEVPFAFYALTATDSGELVGGAEDDLLLIDPDTCASSFLSQGADHETSGDLVGLPDGFLYWTTLGGRDKPDELVRVHPQTGQAQRIGSVGFDRLFGLAYAEGQLYGFSSSGDIIRIDPRQGHASLLAHTGDLSWWGAATNPVAWD